MKRRCKVAASDGGNRENSGEGEELVAKEGEFDTTRGSWQQHRSEESGDGGMR